MEFYNSEQRKGRKDYRCEMCSKIIPKGTEHIYESGKWDGSIFERRRHIHCHLLAEAYFAQAYDLEYTTDEIEDYISEICCDCPGREECAKETWECEKIFDALLDDNEKRAARESVEEAGRKHDEKQG